MAKGWPFRFPRDRHQYAANFARGTKQSDLVVDAHGTPQHRPAPAVAAGETTGMARRPAGANQKRFAGRPNDNSGITSP